MPTVSRPNRLCDRCGQECSDSTYRGYHGLCAACWRTPKPSPCTCDPRTPGVACEACWAEHMADLDDAGGWPPDGSVEYADEAHEVNVPLEVWVAHLAAKHAARGDLPELPESAYFGADGLAELFEPSEADTRWHAEQMEGGV
jgi:hypothetical protein